MVYIDALNDVTLSIRTTPLEGEVLLHLVHHLGGGLKLLGLAFGKYLLDNM